LGPRSGRAAAPAAGGCSTGVGLRKNGRPAGASDIRARRGCACDRTIRQGRPTRCAQCAVPARNSPTEKYLPESSDRFALWGGGVFSLLCQQQALWAVGANRDLGQTRAGAGAVHERFGPAPVGGRSHASTALRRPSTGASSASPSTGLAQWISPLGPDGEYLPEPRGRGESCPPCPRVGARPAVRGRAGPEPTRPPPLAAS